MSRVIHVLLALTALLVLGCSSGVSEETVNELVAQNQQLMAENQQMKQQMTALANVPPTTTPTPTATAIPTAVPTATPTHSYASEEVVGLFKERLSSTIYRPYPPSSPFYHVVESCAGVAGETFSATQLDGFPPRWEVVAGIESKELNKSGKFNNTIEPNFIYIFYERTGAWVKVKAARHEC